MLDVSRVTLTRMARRRGRRGSLAVAIAATRRSLEAFAATSLPLARRPTIGLGARAAHQHRALAVAQAVGLDEGLDSLLVVDDRIGARPVRAPKAALESPGIEHAGERIPDVRERIRLLRQRAGAADLDHHVWAPGEVQHLRQVGPGL